MKHQAPAFQAYAHELLALSMGLSLGAVGAVHRLFLVMWGQSADQCALIDDDQMIARTIGTSIEEWRQLRQEIQHPGRPIFEEKNDRLISPYLRQEAAKQRKYRKSQSEKGKKSAELRLNRGSTVVQPMHQPEGNSSSSSSLKNYRERKGSRIASELNGHGPSFEVFWAAYPKKEGKGVCRRWWKEHRPDDVLLDRMLAKIEQAKQTPKWKELGGKFIAMPATWLNQERWDDEYTAAAKQKERIPL